MGNETPFELNDSSCVYSTERPVSAEEILTQARIIIEERFKPGTVIRSPEDTHDYLIAKLAHLDHEVFAGMFLDNRHKIIAFEILFIGTIDGTSVYPREVARKALKLNAAAVILAHNHPSGIPEPSAADERITGRLKSALELIDMRLLDHIVVGGTQTVSLASRGLL